MYARPGANELLKVMKEHATWFHDHPNYAYIKVVYVFAFTSHEKIVMTPSFPGSHVHLT